SSSAVPPDEKATARADETRQSRTNDGTGNTRRWVSPKRIVELEPTGESARRQIEIQLDSCGAAKTVADSLPLTAKRRLRSASVLSASVHSVRSRSHQARRRSARCAGLQQETIIRVLPRRLGMSKIAPHLQVIARSHVFAVTSPPPKLRLSRYSCFALVLCQPKFPERIHGLSAVV